MASLPPEFLAKRKEMLIIAADRVFRGATTPIPEMEAWPGIYRPLPKADPAILAHMAKCEAHREANQRYREANRRPKPEGWVPSTPVLRPSIAPNATKSRAAGTLEPGTRVEWRGMVGQVLAFIPSEINPSPLVPSRVPRTCIKGLLEPVGTPRYLVAVKSSTGLVRYHCPRAVDVEKNGPEPVYQHHPSLAGTVCPPHPNHKEYECQPQSK